MRYIIYLGLLIIGAAIVSAGGFAVLEPPNSVVYLLFGIGGLLGLSLARLFYRYVDRPLSVTPNSRNHRVSQSYRPFADRLGRFSGFDASDRAEDFTSNMPVWTRHESCVRTPPRPSFVIHRILIRIRAIIRGDSGTRSR
ncbi:hypothetical protein [Allorhodopirellula heiligendammensis]|uniref:Uncharacterized protein n=1 Tax=Allorhodopirellula heiligendammensis TaxID=2714739 RepID=A0A5C6C8U5_9BACT|nr:hypothetical protein [Allorhodopirellula heiligendammensis]TWU19189.1 hypothetical protein Poly21_13600 [Allorhodopirellula heiligendammensis]